MDRIYYALIQKGLKIFDEVPSELKEKVKSLLEEGGGSSAVHC